MKINIVKPYLPHIDDIYNDFKESLESGMVSNNSPRVRELESGLGSFFNSSLSPLLFCNGEMALFTLIQAHKLKLGYSVSDTFDVLVPSLTFSGTINAILMNNLRPVFCDVDDSLLIDISKCNVTENIKMMVIVGAYGNLPNIEEVTKFTDQYKIPVIFDNAPAFGSKYKEKYTSNYGYSEIFSFHASKTFTTMEGGVAITNDKEIWDYLFRLRDFGQYEKVRGNVDVPGLNSKMQEISAIVGLSNLKNVDTILEKRKNNIDRYSKFFTSDEMKENFKVMRVTDDVYCNYLYYPIILKKDATDFVDFMENNGIIVRRYYTAVHELDLYKDKFKTLDLSYTNKVKDRLVSIPIHTIMGDDEIDYIFDTVKKYYVK